MEQQQESEKEFVIRKLNDDAINISGVIKATGVSRSTIYRIKNDKETIYSPIKTLFDYFEKLGE